MRIEQFGQRLLRLACACRRDTMVVEKLKEELSFSTTLRHTPIVSRNP